MDTKVRAAVHRVDILNGRVVHVVTLTRNVFTRRNGTHYIVSLGGRVPVTKLDNDNYLETQYGRSLAGGISIGHEET